MAIFLESLKANGKLDSIHITICNVGSRKLNSNDDFGGGVWNIFAPNLTIYGFDADADACEAANADIAERQINWTERHIPLALGGTPGESLLYVTEQPMCSSLFPPNEPYVNRFAIADAVSLDFTIGIETTTLDIFCESENIHTIDFLQVDVQGAELEVFKGAASRLSRSVLAIQTEVEFSELYAGQPLFADVDLYLRSQDFTLFNLGAGRSPRSQSPLPLKDYTAQLLWSDALYFRDPLQASEQDFQWSPEKVLKLACVSDALGFSDYALELLKQLTLKHGSDERFNFYETIADSFNQIPELAQQGVDSLEFLAQLRASSNP